MSKANVVFTLGGTNMIIQCSKSDKMRNICEKFAVKSEKNINSLVFLYSGNQLNLDLTFEEHANSLDKTNNEMKVLVYETENGGFICNNCGVKIKLNTKKIDELIQSFNNIKDTIEGIKLNIDNLIKLSTMNSMNIQLKNINFLLGSVNEDIKKNNKLLEDLFNDNNHINMKNKNFIRAELDIKSNENNNIILFNTDNNDGMEVYLENNKINMINVNNQWKIDYKFIKDGKYIFYILFNNNITNMEHFFENCSNLISVDLSNFNSSYITNMTGMFNGCKKLKEIKGLNKLNTSKVTDMSGMFNECNAIEY